MTGKRTLTALIVLAMLVASVGPALGAGATDPGGTIAPKHDDPDDEYGDDEYDDEYDDDKSADEAYVTGDGDVILVYNYSDNEEGLSGHAGANASAGLAHVNLTSTDVDTEATGNLSVTATRDSMLADGTLSMPKPDALDSLQVEYVTQANDSDAASSLDLNASVALSGNARAMGLLQEISTDGYVSTTPTTLTSNGSVSVSSAVGVGMDRTHHFVLTEDEGSYTIDAEESFAPSSFAADQWDTRSAAEETLDERYCSSFESSAASCTVSLDSYSFTDGQVSVEYTVTMNGVDSAVASGIVDGLTGPGPNVSAPTAQNLADHVSNVSLDRIEATLDVSGTSGSFTWNVSMSGSDDLALAYADFLGIYEEAATSGMAAPGGPEMLMMGGQFGSSPGQLSDQLVAQVEAQRASGYTGTVEWGASLTTGDGAVTVVADVDADSTNRSDYVTELEARGVNASGRSETIIDARTSGDRLVIDASKQLQQEGLYTNVLGQYEEQLTSLSDSEAVTDTFDAIRRAGFTDARLEVVLTGDEADVESAVAVENGTALSTALPGPYANITSSYTSVDGMQTTVRLDDAVSDTGDAEAVRSLALVGEDTEINLAGEWNRSFQSMDVQHVRAFLGQDGGSGDGGMPMVVVAGGATAVAALGGGLLLFGRGL